MKIAILTLPLHTNYGGILQAYALQTVLERMGHTVEVLQKKPGLSHSPLLMPLVYGKRLMSKLAGRKGVRVFAEHCERRENVVIRKHTDRFIERHIHLREIASLADIRPDDYEAIVVGSDQIWRKPYFREMWHAKMSDAFLEFTRGWDIKRIAYAASFGVDDLSEYTPDEIRQCTRALQLFDAVSVREDSGVRLCREHLGVEADHVLDPTMLLTREDYVRLVEESHVAKSEGDMLCYILDSTPFKTDVVNRIASERGLTPFNVNAPVDDISRPLSERTQPPVEAWLRGFMDAEFVVTDSFHACVFSIIFGKPFIAIGNASRGLTRFTSLLKMFYIQDNLITSESGDNKKCINHNLGPTSLNNYRGISNLFLYSKLGENE